MGLRAMGLGVLGLRVWDIGPKIVTRIQKHGE